VQLDQGDKGIPISVSSFGRQGCFITGQIG
jgi:hypothetical protein